MSRTQTLGEYILADEWMEPISRLELTLLPLDLIVQWRRCGMTADYIASFLAYHFEDAERAMNVLSTVLNELIENSVKFSADKRIPVSVVATYFGAVVTLEATNSANVTQIEKFTPFIEELLVEDAETLFVNQIEQTAMRNQEASGLGLITIKKDFLSGFGVRIREAPGVDTQIVSVQLHIDADLVDRV